MSLNIYDRRERLLVAIADQALAAAASVTRPFRRRRPPRAPTRILVLRLERIGDLLMTLPALADLRAFAPDATIDLVVGSWNADLARAIDPVTGVQCLDASWLAREVAGSGVRSLAAAARRWREVGYDLAINFEPDIRGNVMLAAAGAGWTAGFCSGGGGPLLDLTLDFDTRAHTSDNARRLVAAIFESTVPAEQPPTLVVPSGAHENASRLLIEAGQPLIGVHVSGGRAIKQWPVERFADVARRLVEHSGATIVLSGAAADRDLVQTVKAVLPAEKIVDVAGHVDLLTLAGLIERLDLLVTGDTGPLHLAVAVGTPVLAVFGPSDPVRYEPRGAFDRVVRVDLPCSPCNRIRRPPARCVGHTPDCLVSVTVQDVFSAALSVLEKSSRGNTLPVRLLPND
jgi:lipopolysaccharide heptosyltransferase II